MDLTIKRIPTQAVADRIMSLAVNVVDQALERDAKTLSETAESSLSSVKEQFRRDNGLPV